MTRPPARCNGCQSNRVAWVTPRVDYCYDCLPGGPFVAPACRHCDSPDYFSDGQCDRCHPGGPRYLDSCRGCLAFGVVRRHSWLCWPCRWWKTHYPTGRCQFCRRESWVAEQGACRLCLDHARSLTEPGRAPDIATATRHGQQLFLANVRGQLHRSNIPVAAPAVAMTSRPFAPTAWRQQVLFALPPDPDVVRRAALTIDTDLVAHCKTIVAEHAATHGWSKRQRNSVVASLRMLAYLQDTPGAKINATDVLGLPRYDGNIVSTLEVLDVAGLLIDDRPAQVERYFADKTAGLPQPMLTQLHTWLQVMLHGSTSAPRQRARDPETIKLHIVGIAPILHTWADGHRSLAQITTDDVRNALPASGSRRNFADYGLRSLFSTLKARKLIFTDPTRAIPATPVNATVPLPLDTQAIRDALNASHPRTAAAVALVAFHALTSKQIQQLKLTDIVDGRLTLDGRAIPLAGPVRVRLTAWLDHRAATWPHTINPHLFLSNKSAPRLTPIGRQFPWTDTNIRPQALREDRILQEIHATGGDIRRICDLFDINVHTALRYADTLEHPDLSGPTTPSSGTPTPN